VTSKTRCRPNGT